MAHLLSRSSARSVAIVSLLVALFLFGPASPASAVGGTPINSAGPLTQILLDDDTQCQVFHTGDTDAEFYGDSDSGACGTFVALGGILYGPDDLPAGGDAEPRTVFTPVSQTAVSGDGSATSPFAVVTVVDLGTSGFRLTQTDSYVVGQEAYLTSIVLANTTGSSQSAVIYRAGDCYLQNSDDGYGQLDGTAVGCRATNNERIEQWYPLTPGSTYMEGNYDDVWAAIGTQQPFANTCLCSQNPGDEHDNGAGLSWVPNVAAGSSATVSHFTTFSPLGIQPLSITKTADAPTAPAGLMSGYTVSISNPAASNVSLSTITDTLPSGFSYVAGSTTQGLTADPTISGQALTWNGPISVPASSTLTFHFSVTVSSVAGTFTNSVEAAGPGLVVIGASGVAPIQVTGSTGTTAPGTTATTGIPVVRPVFTG